MTITLNTYYDVTLSTALLGYVGETNARPVSVEGMEIDGADRYVLTIDYGDGTVYEVDITGGQWTPTADILRSAQTISCQIAAKKLAGNEYVLVKKSRIFRLRIGAAIGDTAIPSPDVAMDALDRIDAIGRQTHADMQTAVTAAETATTAAENATKSATAAGLSADTATQAAERAETAKTSAETSATQAETAMQGAETARAEAVTAQNAAKISADLAASAAQQTTADKTATAGYAKTAKTCADSTAADRQAVQEMAEQVTADKATVAENAAQVAEDRTAAETAAQTAQSIADSLPEDYVTAVGKIAENTAEIGRVKLTDKELQRRVNALYDLGNGITHKFETNTDTSYAKTVPTGGKLMSVKNIGGRSIVFNQLAIRTTAKTDHYGITVTVNDDGTINLHGTVSAVPSYNQLVLTQQFSIALNGHKYLYRFSKNTTTSNQYGVCGFGTKGTSSFVFSDNSGVVFAAMPYIHVAEGDVIDIDNLGIGVFDLTAMFGSGKEPSTVEEFEKIFPADYYPYNAGEIVSAGTEEVVEQGKNLFDYTDKIYHGANVSKVENGVIYTKSSGATVLNIPTIVGNKYTLSFKVKSNNTIQDGLRWSLQKGKNISYVYDDSLIEVKVGFTANTEYQVVVTFVADTDFVSLCTIMTMVYDVQLEVGDTATAYAPYHSNVYQIPEAIKALPGYGWSAGTAKNYVDYENKKYYKCIDSMDLGAVRWQVETSPTFGTYFGTFVDSRKFKKIGDFTKTRHNILCEKYITVKRDTKEYVDKTILLDGTVSAVTQIQVKDTAYTDATAFKQAMQGVMLYYELATPIVTDISDLIPDDFLRNLTVEAGGSITFKNSNGDSYHIPVPNEEEYIVKLSEVGGTT